MDKKLVRHGKSLALIIDKPILDALGIDENTLLDTKVVGNTIIIIPIPSPKRRPLNLKSTMR